MPLAHSARAESPQSGSVRGSFTIAGEKMTPTHVYAVLDKWGSSDIRIYLKTSPSTGWREAGGPDGTAPLVNVTLHKDGKLSDVWYVGQGEGATLQIYGPSHVFEKVVFDGSTVSGRVRSEKPLTGFDKKSYEIDVTFKAPILRQKPDK